ncbi:MAG: hypothetical protein CMP48_27225 [Rickettsiales bacterium]|nr:hypothetical protein [Rickettsiales bacterium]
MRKSIAVLFYFIVGVFYFIHTARANSDQLSFTGEQLKLDGSWFFYWETLLTPDDSITQGVPVMLPQFWNKHPAFNPSLPSSGYGTYRTTVFADKDYEIGLEYYAPHSAQRIFVNTDLVVQTGIVGVNEDSNESLWLPGTARAYLHAGLNTITIQVSNYDHANGGIFGTPVIGLIDVMNSVREHQVITESFIIGAIFILGCFFIGLFLLWRRDFGFLYYGLFAVFFGIWYGNYGLHLMKVIVDMEWSFSIRLTYVSFYGFLGFMILYILDEYRSPLVSWVSKGAMIVFGLFILSVLVMPSEVFTSYITIAHVFGFVFAFFGLFLAGRGVFQKKRGSLLTIAGNISFLIAKFSLFGMYHGFLDRSAQLTAILYLSSFLLYAMVLAQRIGLAFTSAYRLQQETKSQKDEIESQANQLSRIDQFKSRFFANVSHDFRSPLTLVKGYLSGLRQEDNILTPKSNQMLEKAEKNVEQLVMLTDEIRDLISLDNDSFELKFSTVKATEFFRMNVGMFQSLAEQSRLKLQFESKLNDELEVVIDRYQMEKVIYNLLSNAIKFTPENGTVSVGLDISSSSLQIIVRDSGIGISEEDLPHIFDRYFQGRSNEYRSKEGLGIGLAFVREIIDRHDGNIVVESTLGTGTIFKVAIPTNINRTITEGSTPESFIDNKVTNEVIIHQGTAHVDYSAAEVDKSHTILVVDDHPEVREYIVSTIPSQYYVLSAGNGQEALEVLKTQKVDLLVTDLMMPLMDGFELIEKIKADLSLKQLRIMVVSARTSDQDLDRVLEIGVNDVLSKPFDPAKFSKYITNLLQGVDEPFYQHIARDKGIYSSIEKDTLKKLHQFILSEIDNSKLTVAKIAEHLITSERSAHRLVNELTGMPPKKYIKKVRFDYIEALIKEGRVKNLTEAGKAIGISTSTEFSRQYQKEKGINPNDLFVDK